MSSQRTYDLFISHAWRHHEDWTRLVEMIDADPSVSWRNFSVPWYDPAWDVRTANGGAVVRRTLETQIIPAMAVILLGSVFYSKSAKKWIDMQLEMARRHQKRIVALPPWGKETAGDELTAAADRVSEWNVTALLQAVDETIANAAETPPQSG